MPQQNTNAQPTQTPTETHVIASPNPTVDDSKVPATTTPKKAEGTPVKASAATTQSPMKTTTKSKSKKHRRTRPRS